MTIPLAELERKRLDYDELTSSSVVFDVGGYKGQWTSSIQNKYQCNVYIFEPVKSFYDSIEIKFKDNLKINVFNFGLYDKNAIVPMIIKKDSSSIMNAEISNVNVTIRDVFEVFEELKIDNVGLMKINIEGSEYDLMKRILDTGLNKKIVNFQIQFHSNVHDYVALRNEIRNRLKETHIETYNREMVWENWKIK